MNELSLEVLQHIGLHLYPHDYQKLRISARTALPLKQRMLPRTLFSSNEWKNQLYIREKFFDLVLPDLDYISLKDFDDLEQTAFILLSKKIQISYTLTSSELTGIPVSLNLG